MNIKLRRAPKSVRLAPRKGYDPALQKLRSRVKVRIVGYDPARYLIGLKLGLRIVAKFFAVRIASGTRLTPRRLEKFVLKRIVAGDFDKEIRKGVKKGGPTPKAVRKRGRPPKNAPAAVA